MDKKTKTLIFKVLKNTISLLLCVTATVSMLGATLISVARDYLQSEQFYEQIETTDLSSVKFVVNNSKVTVLDFVRAKASDYLENQMPSSFFPIGNYAVDKLVTPLLVKNIIKNEVYGLLDYFLNTSVTDAEYRIENGVTIQNNEELNIDNARTVEEAISIYARKFVLQSIENVSGMSTDKLIILISEQTVSKLITLAVILLVILVAINITTIFNLLLYGGFVGVLYGAVIKIAQNKFDQWNAGLEDLVGYVFLKPLADAYSPNATTGFIVGIILIALFVGVYFLFKNFVNKDKTEEQK
ncbi:MAG: hypothetical protein J6Q50_05620 [Clostridia bacterium]|nr:hypothetical protein [Clostridia bacterium]